MKHDFEGWATKNDLRCADGLTIRKDAFKVNDGTVVPLIWNHQHGSIGSVLGHALLKNRPEGIYAYGYFNNTAGGKDAKEILAHGDVVSLSIHANNVQQVGSDVVHGVIRELSLVLAGANPGAMIESVISHGMSIGEDEDEAIIYCNEGIVISNGETISHAEPEEPKKDEPKKEGKDPEEPKKDGDLSVGDVVKTMNDDQKKALAILIGQAIIETKKESPEGGEEGGKSEMKHNMFYGMQDATAVRPVIGKEIMHSLMDKLRSKGSFKAVVEDEMKEGGLLHSALYGEDGVLSHALDTTGMDVATGTSVYGFNDPEMLFPDYKSLTDRPEWISRNMDWVDKLLAKVHHTPFSRVKSLFANITEDEARARGYMKGNLKKEEVFSLLKRTTDPQTIYKKQKLDKDDIRDITSFDIVAWIKAEMQVMMREEKARAMLLGDGRLSSDEDKISEDHIRPVVTDKPLFNTVVKVRVAANADEATVSKAIIRAVIKARKSYKGTGKPDFWTTDDVVTDMLLLENQIGDAVYKTEAELATKLRVNEIIPVEPMEGKTVTLLEGEGDTKTTKEYPLIGCVVNFADYNVGRVGRDGDDFFEDFDIDYNQQKYLYEDRFSGALVKPFAALTIVLDREGGTRAAG